MDGLGNLALTYLYEVLSTLHHLWINVVYFYGNLIDEARLLEVPISDQALSVLIVLLTVVYVAIWYDNWYNEENNDEVGLKRDEKAISRWGVLLGFVLALSLTKSLLLATIFALAFYLTMDLVIGFNFDGKQVFVIWRRFKVKYNYSDNGRYTGIVVGTVVLSGALGLYGLYLMCKVFEYAVYLFYIDLLYAIIVVGKNRYVGIWRTFETLFIPLTLTMISALNGYDLSACVGAGLAFTGLAWLIGSDFIRYDLLELVLHGKPYAGCIGGAWYFDALVADSVFGACTGAIFYFIRHGVRSGVATILIDPLGILAIIIVAVLAMNVIAIAYNSVTDGLLEGFLVWGYLGVYMFFVSAMWGALVYAMYLITGVVAYLYFPEVASNLENSEIIYLICFASACVVAIVQNYRNRLTSWMTRELEKRADKRKKLEEYVELTKKIMEMADGVNPEEFVELYLKYSGASPKVVKKVREVIKEGFHLEEF